VFTYSEPYVLKSIIDKFNSEKTAEAEGARREKVMLIDIVELDTTGDRISSIQSFVERKEYDIIVI
jgi:hypothetical protein